ncbi:MAG: hypothetical protein ACP5OV_06850 [Acidimicrobiales bacterium]
MSSETSVLRPPTSEPPRRLRGLVNLVLATIYVAAVVFALAAGVGWIWHRVTGPTSTTSAAAPVPTSSSTPSAVTLKMSINPPPLGGVKGQGGLIHDAFVPGMLTMKAGTTYDVVIYNYDPHAHTWTLPNFNINANAPAGSASSPSVTHFTITPKSKGTFQWFCALPCDKWSMATNGYMRGYLKVIA